MKYLRTGHTLTALTLSVTTLCSPAFSQEGTGIRGNLSFSQSIELDVGDDFSSRTDLSFGISSATRTENFSFSIGSEVLGDFGDNVDQTFEVTRKRSNLRYARDGANSRLRFSAAYREAELGDELIEGIGGEPIISTGGRAERVSANLGLDFGVEGPLGLELDFAHRNTDYIGTVDPDLVDFETNRADALARFRLSPALTARARAGISRTDEEDLVNTETVDRYVGVGVQTSTAAGLEITADVLFDETEVTIDGPDTSTDDGLGLEVEVTQETSDGSVGFTLASRVDETGRRTSASVNRTFNLRDGGLALSLGVVDQDGDEDLHLIGGVTYERATRGGEITARLAQQAGTASGVSVLSTSVDLGITQEINSASSWSAGVGFSASDELDGEYDSRTTATISYTRDLTSDWNMNTGLEYSRDRNSKADNTIFFTIERDFTFGF